MIADLDEAHEEDALGEGQYRRRRAALAARLAALSRGRLAHSGLELHSKTLTPCVPLSLVKGEGD